MFATPNAKSGQCVHKRQLLSNTCYSKKHRDMSTDWFSELDKCVHTLLATTSGECIRVKVYDVHAPTWNRRIQEGHCSVFGDRFAYPGSILGNSGYGLQAMHIARRINATGTLRWTLPARTPWSHLKCIGSLGEFISDDNHLTYNGMPPNVWFLAAVLLGIVIKFDTQEYEQLYSVFSQHLVAVSVASRSGGDCIDVIFNHRPENAAKDRIYRMLLRLEQSILFDVQSTPNGMVAMNLYGMLIECPWEEAAVSIAVRLSSIIKEDRPRTIADYYARALAALVIRKLAIACPWYDASCDNRLQRRKFIKFVTIVSIYAVLMHTAYEQPDPLEYYDGFSCRTSRFLPRKEDGDYLEYKKLLSRAHLEQFGDPIRFKAHIDAIESCIATSRSKCELLGSLFT